MLEQIGDDRFVDLVPCKSVGKTLLCCSLDLSGLGPNPHFSQDVYQVAIALFSLGLGLRGRTFGRGPFTWGIKSAELSVYTVSVWKYETLPGQRFLKTACDIYSVDLWSSGRITRLRRVEWRFDSSQVHYLWIPRWNLSELIS